MRYAPVPDYHMHTPRCNHAIGRVREYAAAAIRLGLQEIGMSDHSPMPAGYDEAWRMRENELCDYLREVEEVRDRFAGRLTIRLGLEADFHPGTEDYVREMIAGHPWDYVIGSVHYINDWAFDNEDDIARWEAWDIGEAYCAYYGLVAQSAASGMFDIIGHPDLIKKFGHRPPPASAKVRDAEETMLEAVRDSGTALEISSAGLRKPVGEVYPHGRILARAAAMEIPFAFGSDAHAPGQVGHAMDACLAMLEACGIKEIACFEKRRRHMRPIRRISA
ncbi:MAG: histidinol-phosphatase HisJ family protein [Mariprofundaceae bacterium]|nr:histidinol-phosphatase HisJ family protein [Mariprofundaceae bacterium]